MNPQAPASTTKSSNILSSFSVTNMRALLHTEVSPSMIHWFGMSFVVVILLWLVTYVTTKLNLKRTNCLSIQSYYNEIERKNDKFLYIIYNIIIHLFIMSYT